MPKLAERSRRVSSSPEKPRLRITRLCLGNRAWRYVSSQPSCCIRSARVLPIKAMWSPGLISIASARADDGSALIAARRTDSTRRRLMVDDPSGHKFEGSRPGRFRARAGLAFDPPGGEGVSRRVLHYIKEIPLRQRVAILTPAGGKSDTTIVGGFVRRILCRDVVRAFARSHRGLSC